MITHGRDGLKLRDVHLDDKYKLESGQIFVTGIQALVRLPMLQYQLDRRHGLNTAGFVTGYRGSPLGAIDQQMILAKNHLFENNITFQPGVNEDLAATAVWGTQQAGLAGDGLYDGVFSMLYAKGPGVDRSGDVLRHGNLAGSSSNGGVLLLMGDDHACESSTTAHQSEYSLINTLIPVLNPAGVEDIFDFGLYGWSLSRYSGCWVGLKCVHDTIEASASIRLQPDYFATTRPEDFQLPEGGLNIRWPDTAQLQERRMHQFKMDALQAFARTNPVDRRVLGDDRAHTGIISTGKSYQDVRRALLDLKIDNQRAQELGVALYKVGLSWPLESNGIVQFARGLDQLIVVEEKRGVIEEQLKNILYRTPHAPPVMGKVDESGEPLFPAYDRLDATQIAIEIGSQLTKTTGDGDLNTLVDQLKSAGQKQPSSPPAMVRTPYFCAGCPHNSSTVIPEGSRALAGIGCHYLAQWMDRNTDRFTQMGGEGAGWIGESPYCTTNHVFQNIGDGTYFHSGLLAIRAAIASGVNITFKILYNDAVAMTGGQPMDGPLDVARISRQVDAEGVKRIAVVTDDIDKYPKNTVWAPGVSLHHRDQLQPLQKRFSKVKGTSVIIFDQTCAAELRRRRKRGTAPLPQSRLFIHQEVCEGCGDCGAESNCVALVPANTQEGRKRRIDQSACNMDYSCLKGFCPSFVRVVGATRRVGESDRLNIDWNTPLPPEPTIERIEGHYNIILTGVGGTGVVTAGALLGMAAHLAKRGCSVLDMMGLAQKGGAVTSHIILAQHPEEISATHIGDGGADLLLGCDLVTSAAPGTLKKLNLMTHSIINTHEMMPGGFTRHPDQLFPAQALLESIGCQTKAKNLYTCQITELAEAVFGETITTNLILLGIAFQSGRLPLPGEAIERAIDLNDRDVETNIRAFRLGRHLAAETELYSHLLNHIEREKAGDPSPPDQLRLDDYIERLTLYHSRSYAQRLDQWAGAAREAEKRIGIDNKTFSQSVTAAGYHLLASKDEYEVARLFTLPIFFSRLNKEFEEGFQLRFHLAPPLISRADPERGRPRMREFGPSILTLFKFLSAVRRIRGTFLDPFRMSPDRKLDYQLRDQYETTLKQLNLHLSNRNYESAVTIARLPLSVKGYGPVKELRAQQVRQELKLKLDQFCS